MDVHALVVPPAILLYPAQCLFFFEYLYSFEGITVPFFCSCHFGNGVLVFFV